LKEDARIHYVITDGGGQPNVVPGAAEVWYYLRADSHADAETIFRRMEKIARGAALMTETDVEVRVDSDSHELLPNRPLSELLQVCFELAGAPAFTAEEKEFARKTQEPLVAARGAPIEIPLAEGIEPLALEPELTKASTDVGDVSWVVPTSGLRAACYTRGAPGHSWQIVASTGMSIGEKGLVAAAKTLAAAAVELASDPARLAAARADFVARRGKTPFTKLIPAAQKAPARIR
ncbi:MAG: peptidase dimerization domain-containing protein, partial [Planctomycetes bacterium]|nr:peptidase dimerization domain-containing protein [Planctomycetota bacterium]